MHTKHTAVSIRCLFSSWSVSSFVFVPVQLQIMVSEHHRTGLEARVVSPQVISDWLPFWLSWQAEAWGLWEFWLRGALPPRVLGGMLGQPRHSSQEAWGQAEARLWQVWLWDMGGNSHMHSHTLLLQDAMPYVLCRSKHGYKIIHKHMEIEIQYIWMLLFTDNSLFMQVYRLISQINWLTLRHCSKYKKKRKENGAEYDFYITISCSFQKCQNSCRIKRQLNSMQSNGLCCQWRTYVGCITHFNDSLQKWI